MTSRKKQIQAFVLTLSIIVTVCSNILSLKSYFNNEVYLKNLESNLNFNSAPFVYNVDSINNFIYSCISKKINFISNEENFTLLNKDNEKKFFLIDYKLQFTTNYNELMQILEKFSDSRMIYKILNLSFNNIDYNQLQITLNLQALAYDKK
ncbi:MAG: hypothetical protein K9G11_02250 [Rickettsiaceae bacterium]|nr:hypothetical protein [Rickettsiaceae bacterium]